MTVHYELKDAEASLAKADPEIAKIITVQSPLGKRERSGYFYSLCRSIIGQQVSVAAANAIFGRLEKSTNLNPELVAELNESDMKIIGLSRQKMSYIVDLAKHFVENPKVYNHLDKLPDEDIIVELTAVKGIGVWTAQMFLMFTLLRPDIFPVDDIGIQRAMKLLYGWSELPSKSELIKKAEVWQPYRTVASLHLWQSLKNSPV
jgi:DNA-3-methyladenine glycosylase II